MKRSHDVNELIVARSPVVKSTNLMENMFRMGRMSSIRVESFQQNSYEKSRTR